MPTELTDGDVPISYINRKNNIIRKYNKKLFKGAALGISLITICGVLMSKSYSSTQDDFDEQMSYFTSSEKSAVVEYVSVESKLESITKQLGAVVKYSKEYSSLAAKGDSIVAKLNILKEDTQGLKQYLNARSEMNKENKVTTFLGGFFLFLVVGGSLTGIYEVIDEKETDLKALEKAYANPRF